MKPHEEQHETIKKWILEQLADAYPAATINENNWFQFRYQDVKISLEGNYPRFGRSLFNAVVNIRIHSSALAPAYNRIVCKVPTIGGSLQKVFDKINELNNKAVIARATREEEQQRADALVRLQRAELPDIPAQFTIHREASGRYSVKFFSFLTLEQTRALIAATQGILEQP